MKSQSVKFRTSLLMTLMFVLSFALILPSCTNEEAPFAPDANSDLQVRMAPEWSGKLVIYLDQNSEQTVDAYVTEQTTDAVALIRTSGNENGPQIMIDELQRVISSFRAQYGETESYEVRAVNAEEEVTLLFGEEHLPFLSSLKGSKEGETPDEECGGPCQKITGYSFGAITGGSYVFVGNCTGNDGVSVINQALANCFAPEIGVFDIPCPADCFCDIRATTTVQKTRNCFAGGGTFTSGGCSLILNGPITVTLNLTIGTGICIRQ